jgi:hypothetical protein
MNNSMPLHQPRLVTAIGAVDGTNKVYATPTAFLSGSTQVFHNGVLLRKDFGPEYDGWSETSSTQIEMCFAPRDGDTMHIFYLDEVDSSNINPDYVPRFVEAKQLYPVIQQMLSQCPTILDVEAPVDLLPQIIEMNSCVPAISQVIDLRPQIVGVEET